MTAQLSSDTTEVQQWLRARARPVRTEADTVGADLEPLIARLAEATVVGIGESTRFSRQTFGVRERIFRALVQQHGFRALAIQDGARSGDRLDAYVRTGQGDPAAALGGAWRPWRTADMVAALDWIRAFNEQHPRRSGHGLRHRAARRRTRGLRRGPRSRPCTRPGRAGAAAIPSRTDPHGAPRR